MKIPLKLIPWVIIIVLGLIIFLQRSCQKPCPPITVVHDTIMYYDSIPYSVIVPQPYPVQVVLPPDTFTVIDSAQCMLLAWQYYTKNIYVDTVKDDTSALVVMTDTVFMNKLWQRHIYFKNRRPTQIITNTTIVGDTIPKRVKFFAGITIGRSITEFTFCPTVAYQDRKDHLYSLTYDPFFKNWYGTIFFKIKLKRK